MIERELNEYLAAEFDREDAEISATSPYALRPLGSIGDTVVFAFSDEGERFFVYGGRVVGVVPAGDMTLDDLAIEWEGSAWIAARDPVDVNTSRLGDERIPRAVDRRAAVDAMAARAGLEDVAIQAAEFLVEEPQHLAVVEDAHGERFVLHGERATPVPGVMRELSAWRQLAYVVGLQVASPRAG